MRERNKNIKSSLADFSRYREGKMKDEERNAFERELQKDPFLRDASDGWDSIEPDEGLKDLSQLQKQLKHRLVKPQRVIFYRIAASVAVLVLISSIFILVERYGTPKQIAYVTDQAKPSENIKSAPSTIQPDKSEISEPENRNSSKKRDKSDEQQKKPAYVQPPVPVDKRENAKHPVADSITDTKVNQAEEEVMSDQISAAEPAMTNVKSASASRKESKQLKEEPQRETMPAGYVPPQPEEGKSNFDNYILENIRRPASMSSGQREVVILKFRVHTDGRLDSISVIKSPGKVFSDEAIRLVRSGPVWKPAEENGQPVEDEVRLRIVFK